MIPVSTLYDEYIDRPKLTEQKKTHLSIKFLPPQEGSEQLWFAILVIGFARGALRKLIDLTVLAKKASNSVWNKNFFSFSFANL